ncbi:MAG: hypothetical protein Q7R59_01480 [bacterium]|nr:hypothetical protein [bacterium]
MGILLLTGPAGAGKNTVAEVVVKRRERCAIVDVDKVRWMLVQPHKAPWEGEEGQKQLELGIENSCFLARNFLRENCDVIILDVVTMETSGLYKRFLGNVGYKTILLLPSFEIVSERNHMRPERLSDERIRDLYQLESEFEDYNQKIDNSSLSSEEVAEKMLSFKPF